MPSPLAINRLIQEHNVAVQHAKSLMDQYPEGVAIPADKLAEIQNAFDHEVKLHNMIEKYREEAANYAEYADSAEILSMESHYRKKGDTKTADAISNMFRQWVVNGSFSDTTQEALFNTHMVSNTMSTGTGSEGGFTVPTVIASRYIETLKDYSGMRRVATVQQTASGAPLNFAGSDGTAEEGEIVAENGTATASDPTFFNRAVPVYLYSSKTITVPRQLIQDSLINIDQFVADRAMMRIARIQNRHYTVGTGTGQPTGVTVAATAGKVGTTGQTTTIIYNDLIDLRESVDIAYHANARFMCSQTMRGTLSKLVDSSNRPIWIPAYQSGLEGSAPDRLLGFPLELNNHMPTPAANAKPLVFGSLSQYMIRDVPSLEIQRYTDSVYARNYQVGYQMWMRSGGNLLDTAAVKYYQNSAT